jgi:plastocyanin
MLLLAVFTWLLRPTVPREGAAAPTTPAANVLTPPAPVAAPPATPMALASETPLRRAAPAVPDYNSDLGTEFDPFVIQNSRLRYTPAPGTTWTVEFVAAPPPCDWEAPAPTCAPAFAPALLVIQAGDTVVWQVRDGRHTVTFPASGTPAPPPYLAWLGEATGELNPLAAEPQGNTVYDGTALVGSGVLDENASTYRLTFPQPGHYVYVDLEHPGLLGEIIVLSPADEPVR